MAIVTVRAVPYETMAEFLQGSSPTNACSVLAAQHDRVWVISVINSSASPLDAFEGWDGGPVPLVEDAHDRLALAFDDIEPRDNRDARFVYFDEAMADRVCAFVHRAHTDDAARSDLLLINCHAGVSRSGAIADFARTVLGLDYDTFKRLNPQIVPNAFVLRTLLDRWVAMDLPIVPSR